jgi:putative addiction module component (TIGR02574 family)
VDAVSVIRSRDTEQLARRWDSILKDAQGGAELPVSEAERAELDNRLREDDEHPDAAISWTEARARLRSGS